MISAQDLKGLPPAYGGCTCSCHRTPGIMHVAACCSPIPADEIGILWSRLRDCWDEDQSPSWPQVEPTVMGIFDLARSSRARSEVGANEIVEAEPVAWQVKGDDGVWRYVEMPKTAKAMGMEIRPLYAFPR